MSNIFIKKLREEKEKDLHSTIYKMAKAINGMGFGHSLKYKGNNLFGNGNIIGFTNLLEDHTNYLEIRKAILNKHEIAMAKKLINIKGDEY